MILYRSPNNKQNSETFFHFFWFTVFYLSALYLATDPRKQLSNSATISSSLNFYHFHHIGLLASLVFNTRSNCCLKNMEKSTEMRKWDELIPDALGLIFSRLSIQEILTIVPRVCKSWRRVVCGPYCWQEIDIEEWGNRCKPKHLDRLLRMLIARSCGSFRKLAVSGLPSDALFSYIADNARFLQTLILPRSEITDSIVEQVAHRLSSITSLDLSYSKKLGPKALECFGKNCKSLSIFRRTMHPLEADTKFNQDDEAFAIASSMPNLRHLEVAYLLLTNKGVHEILLKCKKLEFLDLRGCWEVKLDEHFLKEKYSKLKVLGPQVEDFYNRNFWDDCSEDLDSEYEWDTFVDYDDEYDYDYGYDDDILWNNGEGLEVEGLEVRFYGGGFNQAYNGFYWPPSP